MLRYQIQLMASYRTLFSRKRKF